MKCVKCNKECLESELKNNICQECIERTKTKSNTTYIIVITISILAVMICGLYIYFQKTIPSNSYRKQAISILNNYNQGKITSTEAKEKINALSKKTDKEYQSSESIEILAITSILQRIEGEFIKGELSNTETNAYIQEIKNTKGK